MVYIRAYICSRSLFQLLSDNLINIVVFETVLQWWDKLFFSSKFRYRTFPWILPTAEYGRGLSQCFFLQHLWKMKHIIEYCQNSSRDYEIFDFFSNSNTANLEILTIHQLSIKFLYYRWILKNLALALKVYNEEYILIIIGSLFSIVGSRNF